jgi:hypothetical protein
MKVSIWNIFTLLLTNKNFMRAGKSILVDVRIVVTKGTIQGYTRITADILMQQHKI